MISSPERRVTEKEQGRPVPDGPIPYFYHDDFADDSLAYRLLGPTPPGKNKTPKAIPKGVPSYFAHLWTIPLMDRDQESHCFRKLHYLKYLANREWQEQQLGQKRGGRTDRIESLNEGIVRVRNFIVESNLRLVVAIARRSTKSSRLDFDELVSAGNLGLLRATDLFDYRRGLRFSTYAYQAIQRTIFNAIKGSAASRLIEQAEGSEAVASLAGDAAAGIRVEKRSEQARQLVQMMLQTLDQRDQEIIMSRFGIGVKRKVGSFRKIGREIGVSSTRTAQLFHRSLDRMRNSLAENNVQNLDAVGQ